jgi:hypothetical protein
MVTRRRAPRFGMTPPPQPGGNPGDYKERLAQWLLEGTFFLHFVHRNPLGKGGKGELADAVVLYGDAAIFVQVKAQQSPRDPVDWARKEIGSALKQLGYTKRMLLGGHVTELVSETLGPVRFDPARYTHRYGLIVLAQDSEPYSAEDLVPELDAFDVPVHVFSLRDFLTVVGRMDTPGDFLSYLDLRHDLCEQLPHRQVHAEHQILETMAGAARRMMERRGDDPALIGRTMPIYEAMLSGAMRASEDWNLSAHIDDAIARMHTLDPEFPLNPVDPASAADTSRIVAEHLAWLTRERRILLGRELLRLRKSALDGTDHYWALYQRPVDRVYVILATKRLGEDRARALAVLCDTAKEHHQAGTAVGLATDPEGPGCSYIGMVSMLDFPEDYRTRLREFGDHLWNWRDTERA